MNEIKTKYSGIILNACLLSCIGIAIGIMLLPLFQNGIIIGDDTPYHVARINSLAESFKQGHPFIAIRSGFLDGLGYGTGFFIVIFLLFYLHSYVYLGSLWKYAIKHYKL